MPSLMDFTADEGRLLDAYDLLLPEARAEVLQRLQVAACFVVVTRCMPAERPTDTEAPEAVARAFLMKCMPRVPTGYEGDYGFMGRYLDHALPRIEHRCLSLVLGPACHDKRNAEDLTEVLTECAATIASDFCAPAFGTDSEDAGFLEPETVLCFIETWRDNFERNLARFATQRGGS